MQNTLHQVGGHPGRPASQAAAFSLVHSRQPISMLSTTGSGQNSQSKTEVPPGHFVTRKT
jgi:hypothetical protein